MAVQESSGSSCESVKYEQAVFCMRFRAFTAVQLRSLLLWYVAWCRLVIGYLGLRTTNWAHLQASSSSRRRLETCGGINIYVVVSAVTCSHGR